MLYLHLLQLLGLSALHVSLGLLARPFFTNHLQQWQSEETKSETKDKGLIIYMYSERSFVYRKVSKRMIDEE